MKKKNFFDELESDIISKENKIEKKIESKTSLEIDELLNININNNQTPDSNKEKNNNNKIEFNESDFIIKRLNTTQNITHNNNNNNQNKNPKILFEDIFNSNDEEKN